MIRFDYPKLTFNISMAFSRHDCRLWICTRANFANAFLCRCFDNTVLLKPSACRNRRLSLGSYCDVSSYKVLHVTHYTVRWIVDCRVISTGYTSRVHWLHMIHLLCNALVLFVCLFVSTILKRELIYHLSQSSIRLSKTVFSLFEIEPVFPFKCWVLNKGTTDTMFNVILMTQHLTMDSTRDLSHSTHFTTRLLRQSMNLFRSFRSIFTHNTTLS